MIRAVFFDIGGTVHTQRPTEACDRAYAEMLFEALRRIGVRTEETPEKLLEHVNRGAASYKKYTEETLTELPPDVIWKDYMLKDYPDDRELLTGHGEELCYQFDRYRKEIVERPGLAETLEALKADGIRLGIISNIMSRTFVPRILAEYKVADYFETMVLSSVFGIRKPDARIFEEALREMNIRRDEAAYVGDTISRDIRGTRNAGWPLMIQIDNPLTYRKDEAFRGMGYRPDVWIKELPEVVPAVRKYNSKKYGGEG